MKTTFTQLENTRLAYNEANPKLDGIFERNAANKEFALLKKMQSKVDSCLVQPSQNSIDIILAALKSS